MVAKNSGNDLNQRLKISFAMLAIHNVVKNVVSTKGFVFVLILFVLGNFLDATEIREDSLTFPMSEWRPVVRVEMGKQNATCRVGTLQQSRWISTSASTTSRIRTSTSKAFNGDNAFEDTDKSSNDASVLWRECENVHHGSSSGSSSVLKLPLTELARNDFTTSTIKFVDSDSRHSNRNSNRVGNRDGNRNSNRNSNRVATAMTTATATAPANVNRNRNRNRNCIRNRIRDGNRDRNRNRIRNRIRDGNCNCKAPTVKVLWRECEDVHCGTSSPQIWAYAKSGSLVLSRREWPKTGHFRASRTFCRTFKYRGSPNCLSLV
jgi:hypothetical protein